MIVYALIISTDIDVIRGPRPRQNQDKTVSVLENQRQNQDKTCLGFVLSWIQDRLFLSCLGLVLVLSFVVCCLLFVVVVVVVAVAVGAVAVSVVHVGVVVVGFAVVG